MTKLVVIIGLALLCVQLASCKRPFKARDYSAYPRSEKPEEKEEVKKENLKKDDEGFDYEDSVEKKHKKVDEVKPDDGLGGYKPSGEKPVIDGGYKPDVDIKPDVLKPGSAYPPLGKPKHEKPEYKPDLDVDKSDYKPDLGIEKPGLKPDLGIEKTGYKPDLGLEKPGYKPDLGLEKPGYKPDLGLEKPGYKPELGIGKPGYKPDLGIEKPGYKPDIGIGKPGYKPPKRPFGCGGYGGKGYSITQRRPFQTLYYRYFGRRPNKHQKNHGRFPGEQPIKKDILPPLKPDYGKPLEPHGQKFPPLKHDYPPIERPPKIDVTQKEVKKPEETFELSYGKSQIKEDTKLPLPPPPPPAHRGKTFGY